MKNGERNKYRISNLSKILSYGVSNLVWKKLDLAVTSRKELRLYCSLKHNRKLNGSFKINFTQYFLLKHGRSRVYFGPWNPLSCKLTQPFNVAKLKQSKNRRRNWIIQWRKENNSFEKGICRHASNQSESSPNWKHSILWTNIREMDSSKAQKYMEESEILVFWKVLLMEKNC